ncbi:hypothetical protein GGTG_13352 [Gaeumannomyces tritici R3-111a-1]|uniref:RING-type domain-containing protein n=1 Tax=Gaeumannomyces tritici (strain R3-111a-1) TaxID=644352 RepID=J3PIM3_GAET3|nr:hypothetical protein GGTG_13352 [Gaeumannomyces tritici R3-111a-1]EJT69084.1 hypothetical protein GGTG_13352 [Gaeumannomyces tritici R3-111a-1]
MHSPCRVGVPAPTDILWFLDQHFADMSTREPSTDVWPLRLPLSLRDKFRRQVEASLRAEVEEALKERLGRRLKKQWKRAFKKEKEEKAALGRALSSSTRRCAKLARRFEDYMSQKYVVNLTGDIQCFVCKALFEPIILFMFPSGKVLCPSCKDGIVTVFNDSKCQICHEPQSLDQVATTGCGHIYHHQCIGRWLEEGKKQRVQRNCPICRRPGDTLVTMSGVGPEILEQLQAFVPPNGSI